MENTTETKTISNWFKEHARQLLPICLAICLFGLAISGIQTFRQVFICDDEFGYFATSAFLRGLDWSEIVKYIPYYSYGYGMFVLTPITLLFSNPTTIYQAALVVNGLMIVGCYQIARIMTKHLFKTLNWVTKDIICFLIMLYPANMFFSHIAWTETTLLFLFWVYVWISYLSLKKPTYTKYIGWVIVTVLLYVVHQRALGIVCATILVLLVTFIINKEHRKYILSCAVVMLGLFGLHFWFKDYYQGTLYAEAQFLQINDFDGRVESVTSEFSPSGIVKIINSFIGKWFYLMIGTGFIIWWAILALFQKSWIGIRKKYKKSENIFNYRKLWETLILLCFIATFMICVLANLNIIKYDVLLYGRYNEYILGIYLLYGVIYFLKEKKWKTKFFVGCGLSIIAMFVCQYVLNQADTDFYQCCHSICTGLFFEPGADSEGRVIWFGVIGLVIVVLTVILAKSPKWKQYDYARRIMLIMIPILVWTHISGKKVVEELMEGQLFNTENNAPIAEIINGLDLNKKIYFAVSPANQEWVEMFQFWLPKEEIDIVNEINTTDAEAAYYIIETGVWEDEIPKEYYTSIYTGEYFCLIVLTDGEIMQEIEALANGEK